ncbi:hypothetical protein TNCV_3705171 [Trichonephila clavipes]|nr:hypothetical protein TNCV_3705171 [Trichonephila clavipes]
MEYIPLAYVHEAHFRLFGLRPFVLLPKETVSESASHWLVCLDELLTGDIDVNCFPPEVQLKFIDLQHHIKLKSKYNNFVSTASDSRNTVSGLKVSKKCRPSDIKIYPPMGKNFKGDSNIGISNWQASLSFCEIAETVDRVRV